MFAIEHISSNHIHLRFRLSLSAIEQWSSSGKITLTSERIKQAICFLDKIGYPITAQFKGEKHNAAHVALISCDVEDFSYSTFIEKYLIAKENNPDEPFFKDYPTARKAYEYLYRLACTPCKNELTLFHTALDAFENNCHVR